MDWFRGNFALESIDAIAIACFFNPLSHPNVQGFNMVPSSIHSMDI